MKRTTFTFLVIIAGLLFTLVILARGGDVWAAAILAALWTILAVIIGAFVAVYAVRQQGIKQQADFEANAHENLAMMQMLQKIQNEQNRALMGQLGQVSKLPNPNGNVLMIEPGIFDDLEQ